jgi:hypothetical protein
VKPVVANRRIAVVVIALVALAGGCDSKPPAEASGSATPLSNVTTTGSSQYYQPSGAPLPSADPLSTFHLAPPMLAPGRAELAVLDVSPAEVAAVQQDVRRLNDAFYTGDFESVVRMRNASVIEKSGGPEVAVEKMRELLALSTRRGVKVESFEMIARPIFLKSTIREYVLVPTKKILSSGDDRIEHVNFEFGAREIGNPTWTYVDGAQLTSANINTLFPDFPADRRLLEVSSKKL